MIDDVPPEIVDRLRALQRDYATRLPQRIAELEERFGTLGALWTPTEAIELRRLAHNLAGSGAAYGQPEISTAARRMEQALDRALAGLSPPTPDALAAVSAALQALIAAAAIVPTG